MLDTIVKNAKDDRKSQFSAEERINSNIEDISRLSMADGVEEQEVAQEEVQEVVQSESESHNLRLQWLESIESRIETEEKELECSVCLEVSPYSDFCYFF